MSNHDEVQDFLFGSGGKAFQFNNINDTCRGTITHVELRQQTNIDGQLLSWDDGRPRMQLVVTLDTGHKESDEDDGLRTIYAKGGRFEIASGEGQAMRDAIADAVKEAGASKLETGDELAVVYSGVGKAKRGQSAPKLYTAGFRKAQASVAAKDLFDS